MNSSEDILNILINSIKSQGFTEKECLQATQINTSFLTDWKKGKIKTPSYDKIVKLAMHLQLSLDFLLLGEVAQTTTRPIAAEKNLELEKWIELFYSVPEAARPYLIYWVMKDIQNAQQVQEDHSSQKSFGSMHTNEHAAAKKPEQSNIA